MLKMAEIAHETISPDIKYPFAFILDSATNLEIAVWNPDAVAANVSVSIGITS